MIYRGQIDIQVEYSYAKDNTTVGEFIDRLTVFIQNDLAVHSGEIVLASSIGTSNGNRLRNDTATHD